MYNFKLQSGIRKRIKQTLKKGLYKSSFEKVDTLKINWRQTDILIYVEVIFDEFTIC